MALIEIPIPSVDQALIDPNHARRAELIALMQGRAAVPSEAPIIIGKVTDHKRFSAPIDFSVIGMHGRPRDPSKNTYSKAIAFEVDPTSGVARYEWPDELEQFVEALRLIAGHEHGAYPGAQYRSSAALFIDKTPAPRVFKAQRAIAARKHRDGSAWYHYYFVSDRRPTNFYATDPIPHMQETKAVVRRKVTPANYAIAMANTMSIHESQRMGLRTSKTLLRIAYHHQ